MGPQYSSLRYAGRQNEELSAQLMGSGLQNVDRRNGVTPTELTTARQSSFVERSH